MRTFERWSRRLDRVSLAVPLALLLGLALAFALWAMPGAWLGRLLADAGLDALLPLGRRTRAAIALSGGLAGGVPVWALFRWLERPLWTGAPAVRRWPMPAWLRNDATAAADGAPPLRRADAHPDAPSRRPIFAASEMGAPLDTVDEAWTPGTRWSDGSVAEIAPALVNIAMSEAEAEPASAPAPAGEALLLDPTWQSQAPPAARAPAQDAPHGDAADMGAAALMARLESAIASRPSGMESSAPSGMAIDEVMAELRKAVRRG